MYNLTQVGEANNTLEFVQNINTTLMAGWFGVMILGVLFLITFLAFLAQTGQPMRSLTGAGFIGMGFSILLFLLGLIPLIAVYIMIVILAVGIAAWNTD